MTSRRVAYAFGAALLLLGTVNVYQNTSFFTTYKMATSSTIPIEITLSPDTSANSLLGSVSITVTLTNKSPQPLSFLRWSSPLDGHAPAIGVYTFTSLKTGEVAPCLDMKINHRMPASGHFASDDKDIIHILANGKIERVLQFKEPEVILSTGDKYRVKASGSWMGVWLQDQEKGESGGLSMDEKCLRGEFQSNELEVKLPEEGAQDL